MASFPVPELFKITALAHCLSSIDDTTARELNQIALQAECGRLLMKALVHQLKLGNSSILDSIPIPKKLQTEDGWVFYLTKNGEYESADGLSYELTKILELISMTSKERERDLTPEFTIEW